MEAVKAYEKNKRAILPSLPSVSGEHQMRTGHVGVRIRAEASSATNYSYRVGREGKKARVDVFFWYFNVEAHKYLQIDIGKLGRTLST